MVSFIKALDVKWPFNTEEYLKAVSAINSISTSVANFECLVYQYNISGEIVHLKAVFSSILPFCLLITVAIIMIIQFIFSRKNNFNKIWLAFFVICIFLHPNILESLFNNIICIDIENKKYLVKQLDLGCDSFHHNQWVYIFLNKLFFLITVA